MENWPPCKCGREAMHWISTGNHQCCECYVRDGHPPADWHPRCMATATGVKPAGTVTITGKFR